MALPNNASVYRRLSSRWHLKAGLRVGLGELVPMYITSKITITHICVAI